MRKKSNMLLGSLIVVMSISAISFIIMLNQINTIERQNNLLQNELYGMKTDINHISQRISELNESEQWILNEVFKPIEANSTPEEIHLSLTISLKEVGEGNTVHVLYKEIEKSDWKEAPANHTEGLNYRASLQLSPQKEYVYQVVSDGEISRTDEPKEIPSHIYRPAPLTIISDGMGRESNGELNSIRIELSENKPLFSFFRTEKVIAKIYYEDKPGEEIELDEVDYGFPDERYWLLELNETKENINSIYIRTEYANGSIHEGELYPNESYTGKPHN
ncbi:hypothetical protein ACFSTA_02970 [Ornithinibacillus salinisoli]|uniref:Uncharacterized protein n=1 Tax=Ornithinibacillus salinisoli TaxID=1848459 RepID=A0ABW4VVR8_9BACI